MRLLTALLLALCSALTASAAMAGGDGWYASLHLGKGWKDDADMQFKVLSEFVFDTPNGAVRIPVNQTFDADLAYTSGWGFGLAAGRSFGNWRAEGELNWRKSRVGGFELTGYDAKGVDESGAEFELPSGSLPPLESIAEVVNEREVGLGGKASLVTTTLNLYYDFPVSWAVKPYAGAGLGAVHANKTKRVALMTNNFGENCSPRTPCSGEGRHKRSWDFTWQLMAGVRYPFADSWDATLGWRYASLSNVKFSLLERADGLGSFTDNPLQVELGGMHSIELGVLRRF